MDSARDSNTAPGAEHTFPAGTNGRRFSWRPVIVGLLVACALLPTLLKPAEFMQDDSYFYLQVAHNIVEGKGSTFNGITPTNGYHPLWLWMVTVVSAIADGNKTVSLYLVFVLQCLLVVATILVLRRLTASMRFPHWLVALSVLTAYLTATTISGSEAYINAFCLLSGLLCLLSALDRRQNRSWFLAGIVLGTALLARLDNIFVVGALSVIALLDTARDDPRLATTGAVALGLGGALVVLPYLAGNLATYGHLVPISGAIKSTFPAFNPDLDNLGPMGKLSAPFGLVALLIGIFLDRDHKRRVIWLGLGTGVMLHAVYIVGYTDHYTFWPWYYVAGVVTAALSASYLFSFAAARVSRQVTPALASRMALLLAVSILAAGAARAWLKAYGGPGLAPLGVQIRINKYRWPDEFARWMKAHLPPGTRIFVYDWPGAIAYYSDLPLLPMDGLMSDFQYNDDLLRVGVHRYLCDHDVEYFFGLIEPWQRDVDVVVTAPLYRVPVGTLHLPEDDIIVRTDDVLSRPEEALPFAIWKLHCPSGDPDEAQQRKRQ